MRNNDLPGITGVVLVEYTGKSKSVRKWLVGNVTYLFGEEKRFGYVAAEHVEALNTKTFSVTEEGKAHQLEAHSSEPEPEIDLVWIRHNGGAALAQYKDPDLKQVVLPAKFFGTPQLPAHLVRWGIPIGLRWGELFVHIEFDPQVFEQALHDHGIWTRDDWFKRPRSLARAIDSALGFSNAIGG